MAPDYHSFLFRGKWFHNVFADLRGSDPNSCVIISAHRDSTARNDGVCCPAPGADDDASGVAAVLAAAEAAVKLRAAGHQLKRTLRFVFFNVEEDYILGSKEYVLSQMDAKPNITAVFQMDMIGYTGGQEQREFEVHVGCRSNPQAETNSRPLAWTIEDAVGQLSARLNRPQIYPRVPKDYDPLDNRSDHSSFQRQGYRACVICEDGHNGPLATSPPHRENPYYHRQSDKQIDYGYAAEIARVAAAAAILEAKA
jgi:Zn-dependent M28 family amino/carboxypeptidase